jgi:D-alanyl-D-alanine carboxypeptidase (penicillin-binding protein 5/6)
LKVTVRYETPLKAPVAAGQEVGTVTVTVPGKPDKVVPALAAEAVAASGFFDNMMQGLQALVFGTKKA